MKVKSVELTKTYKVRPTPTGREIVEARKRLAAITAKNCWAWKRVILERGNFPIDKTTLRIWKKNYNRLRKALNTLVLAGEIKAFYINPYGHLKINK